MTAEFKQYKRKGLSEMRQIVIGEDLTGVSISEPDKQLMKDFPNIFAQGYIARNPKNHADLWYVAKDYFDENLEPVDQYASQQTQGEWISVEDRLPEITLNKMSNWVITFCEDVCRIDKAFYSSVTGWEAEHGEPMNVTHWQPLPPPPKTTTP